jgi:hypothetical protein
MTIHMKPCSTDHFILSADTPVTVEVTVVNGFVIAHVYDKVQDGHLGSLEQPVGMFHGENPGKEWKVGESTVETSELKHVDWHVGNPPTTFVLRKHLLHDHGLNLVGIANGDRLAMVEMHLDDHSIKIADHRHGQPQAKLGFDTTTPHRPTTYSPTVADVMVEIIDLPRHINDMERHLRLHHGLGLDPNAEDQHQWAHNCKVFAGNEHTHPVNRPARAMPPPHLAWELPNEEYEPEGMTVAVQRLDVKYEGILFTLVYDEYIQRWSVIESTGAFQTRFKTLDEARRATAEAAVVLAKKKRTADEAQRVLRSLGQEA